jgi:lysophospholipase L1-like esterase
MRRMLPLTHLAFAWLLFCLPASALTINGFASMGASETQGNAYTGSWVPYEVNFPGWNFGGAGNPYNVAVGGATSATLLSQGQHTAVASLVAAGNVNLATLLIGGNDFNANATQIASGSLAGTALTTLSHGVVTNIDTAMDTVLAEHPFGMVVASLPDGVLSPGGRAIFNTPTKQARGNAAVDQFNSLLLPEVLSRGLAYIDLAMAIRDLNATPFIVGGVTIDMVNASSDATHFFQDSLHPAAVGNGIIANEIMTAVNLRYGTHYALLTDQQILTAAGLGSRYTAETSTLNYAAYVFVPEPSTLVLAVLGTLALLVYRRRR